MKRHYIALFLVVVGLAALGASQYPTPTRWQYAKTYLSQDTNGKMQWSALLPDGKIIKGEKVADVARQLNAPCWQEGTFGMYNVMGSLGFELVGIDVRDSSVATGISIYKKPL